MSRLTASLFLAGLLAIASTPAQADELWAGAAAIDITPPPGAPMAGYYHARAAEGVHDPLHARALVLDSGGTRAALVVLDLITTPRSSSKMLARPSPPPPRSPPPTS